MEAGMKKFLHILIIGAIVALALDFVAGLVASVGDFNLYLFNLSELLSGVGLVAVGTWITNKWKAIN